MNKAECDLARLVQALLDGVPASVVREKMAELEARRDALRRRLASSEDLSVFQPHQQAVAQALRTALQFWSGLWVRGE